MASSSSTIGEHLKWPKPRNPPISSLPNPNNPNNNNIPSIIQSTRCKSTISSLLLSTFTNTNSNPENPHQKTHKKQGFKASSLRGFGCTAQPEVSVPNIIRTSAQWDHQEKETNKNNKKKIKKKKMKKGQSGLREETIGVQDLWCGPGIGSDAAADSVDCVVSGNNARNVSGRGKIDVNKIQHTHRERPSYSSRQRVNAEHFGSFEPESSFEMPHFGLDVFDERYYHHFRNRSAEGLAEIMMFQNGLLMGRRSGGLDRYRDWRLDVDNMSYEELLELGDKIGYVNTGLGEDQIGRCLRKSKLSVLNEVSSELHDPIDEEQGKCSICQEEYEEDDEVGRLECGHAYHLQCIKQWLAQKNTCPVCKAEASSK